jgi:hypothetical protein
MFTRNVLALVVNGLLNPEPAEGGIVDLNLARNAVEADEDLDSEEAKAERTARLTAADATAKKQANDGTALPDEIVGLAQREIKVCWQEFSDKGGVWDLTQKVRSKLSNISQHILNIAKACAAAAYDRTVGDVDADYVKLAGKMFRNAMAQAELSLRASVDLTEEDGEKKLDAFLVGSWNVYKSTLNTAMGGGFDPRDYDSIYKMQQAVKAAKAEKNGAGEGKGRGAGKGADDDAVAADSDDNDEPAAERTDAPGDDDLADYIVNKQYAKGHGALQLLLRTLGNVDWDKHEDKVSNILNMATKECAKLTLPEDKAANLPHIDSAHGNQAAVQA